MDSNHRPRSYQDRGLCRGTSPCIMNFSPEDDKWILLLFRFGMSRAEQMPLRMQILDETHFPEAAGFEAAAIDVGGLGNFQYPTPRSRASAAARPRQPLADIRYVSYHCHHHTFQLLKCVFNSHHYSDSQGASRHCRNSCRRLCRARNARFPVVEVLPLER